MVFITVWKRYNVLKKKAARIVRGGGGGGISNENERCDRIASAWKKETYTGASAVNNMEQVCGGRTGCGSAGGISQAAA